MGRAERALAEGKMDFWEVCRPMLADPELLRKVAEDRSEEIRPCMGGLMCLSRMFRNLPYICSVNPRLGHEYDPAYAETPAEMPKKVMVIGGGPAGMECARAAAKRGHDVTLFDKSNALGGQTRIAGLEIEEGARAFDALVRRLRPDVAVVATGAAYQAPSFPGADLPHVVMGEWTSPEQMPAGERVVVLSAERAGLVLPERFAVLGRQVTVVGEGKVGTDVIPTFKWRHAAWLEEHGVEVVTGATIAKVTVEGVHVTVGGEVRTLPADLVVVAGPRRSVSRLFEELELSVDELYVVGDAVAPRSLANAIHEGFKLGNRL